MKRCILHNNLAQRILLKRASQNLTRLLMSNELRGMLEGPEGKIYRGLDMFLRFVFAFLHRDIGMSKRQLLKTVNTLYSDLPPEVFGRLGMWSWAKVEPQALICDINHLKKSVMDSFVQHCSTAHLILYLHHFTIWLRFITGQHNLCLRRFSA